MGFYPTIFLYKQPTTSTTSPHLTYSFFFSSLSPSILTSRAAVHGCPPPCSDLVSDPLIFFSLSLFLIRKNFHHVNYVLPLDFYFVSSHQGHFRHMWNTLFDPKFFENFEAWNYDITLDLYLVVLSLSVKSGSFSSIANTVLADVADADANYNEPHASTINSHGIK